MIDNFPNNLEKPDIKISGLEIWVHRRQFPDCNDYWDGNWISITAKCEAKKSCVWVSWSIIHLPELKNLLGTTEKLYQTLKGKAELSCMEPELSMRIDANNLGRMEMTVNITPDHLMQSHEYIFEIDQSYLPTLISECKKVLQMFKIKEER